MLRTSEFDSVIDSSDFDSVLHSDFVLDQPSVSFSSKSPFKKNFKDTALQIPEFLANLLLSHGLLVVMEVLNELQTPREDIDMLLM